MKLLIIMLFLTGFIYSQNIKNYEILKYQEIDNISNMSFVDYNPHLLPIIVSDYQIIANGIKYKISSILQNTGDKIVWSCIKNSRPVTVIYDGPYLSGPTITIKDLSKVYIFDVKEN